MDCSENITGVEILGGGLQILPFIRGENPDFTNFPGGSIFCQIPLKTIEINKAIEHI